MSGTIRDDEYDWLREAVQGCREEGGPGEILDRVLSVVEDILEGREEPIRELCRGWATDAVEFTDGLGMRIRQGVEQQCAHQIFELLNEFGPECDMPEDERIEDGTEAV